MKLSKCLLYYFKKLFLVYSFKILILLKCISIFQVVCTEGPERIRELIAMGASFDHGEDGNLHLAREAGHSYRQIVRAANMRVREIEKALIRDNY